MKKILLLGACGALSFGSQAFAEDSGFYAGAGVGLAHEGFTGYRANDTAFKALAGYSFSRYFSAQAEYVDAGTLKDDVNGLDVAISSEGFIASLLGKWPVNDVLSPYVKVGYAFYDTKAVVTGAGSPFSVSSSESDLVFGAGLEFRLSQRFRLRVEGEKINVSDADFRVYSLAALYQF